MDIAARLPARSGRGSLLVVLACALLVGILAFPSEATAAHTRTARSRVFPVEAQERIERRSREPVVFVLPPFVVELVRSVLPQPLLELLASVGIVFAAS